MSDNGSKRFGPVAVDVAALVGRADAAVPADLLHVVIELDAVAVGVEREGRVVDAGIKLGRDRVDKGDAVRLQERDGLAQLRVAAELDAERHAGRVRAEAQCAAQFLWEQPDAVVLGAAAHEDAARAAIPHLLAADKAEPLAIKRLGALDIVDEQAQWADLGDLERPRQQHPFDVIDRGQRPLRAMTREHVDALVLRVEQFGGLGHLRQRRLFVEAAIIHVARLC